VNAAVSFLSEHASELRLDRYGLAGGMSSLVVTPRFRASRHIVVLVLPAGGRTPSLVVKIPRLRDDRAGVEREAVNLHAAQEARAGGYETIPSLVAYAEHRGRPLLVQTALVGSPMNRAAIRRRPDRCVVRMVDWLEALPRAGSAVAESARDRHRRLIEEPLERFGRSVERDSEEASLVAATLELTRPLAGAELPLVFEHGDLSYPNLLVLDDGRAGVLDWELADPEGLPVTDLCFFLAYVAFCRRNADTPDQQLAAFEDAFLAPGGWARPLVARHAERMGVSGECLSPLFLACWARYAVRLRSRLEGDRVGGNGSRPLPTEPAAAQAADWLRANRYFALWRAAAQAARSLRWHP
jgi:aminoglycoside phosphotransferase (APT) family kinase protein